MYAKTRMRMLRGRERSVARPREKREEPFGERCRDEPFLGHLATCTHHREVGREGTKPGNIAVHARMRAEAGSSNVIVV